MHRQFSVNFHFLKNDNSCNKSFFSIDSVDNGLSFMVLKISYVEKTFLHKIDLAQKREPHCIGPSGQISEVGEFKDSLI